VGKKNQRDVFEWRQYYLLTFQILTSVQADPVRTEAPVLTSFRGTFVDVPRGLQESTVNTVSVLHYERIEQIENKIDFCKSKNTLYNVNIIIF